MLNIFRSISLQIALFVISFDFTGNMYLRTANNMEENNWITICAMSDVTAIGFDDIFPYSVYFKDAGRPSIRVMQCHAIQRHVLLSHPLSLYDISAAAFYRIISINLSSFVILVYFN